MAVRSNVIYNTVSAKLVVSYSQLKLAVRCMLEVMAARKSSEYPEEAFFMVKKKR